jgi:secreted trypsin-like serine protease
MKTLQKLAIAVVLLAIVQVSLSAKLNKSRRIVGGVQADIADFPFQLALLDMRMSTIPGNYWCGASNIHRLWALTAGLCPFQNLEKKNL